MLLRSDQEKKSFYRLSSNGFFCHYPLITYPIYYDARGFVVVTVGHQGRRVWWRSFFQNSWSSWRPGFTTTALIQTKLLLKLSNQFRLFSWCQRYFRTVISLNQLGFKSSLDSFFCEITFVQNILGDLVQKVDFFRIVTYVIQQIGTATACCPSSNMIFLSSWNRGRWKPGSMIGGGLTKAVCRWKLFS